MNIIKSSFEIQVPETYIKVAEVRSTSGGISDILKDAEDIFFRDMNKHIEKCTRISHRSEDKITEGSAEKLLRFIVMGKGDFSVVEHSMLTVEFVFDRGITHELVRHRLFAFTQESTRFVNYEKKMPPSFIYPQVGVECRACLDGNIPKQLHGSQSEFIHFFDDDTNEKCAYNQDWLISISQAEESYKDLLAKGWRPQEARSVFPNALASKIAVTGNLRNWRHTLMMRTSSETHPQFKEQSVPLLMRLKSSPIGWLFEDVEPEGKQSTMMSHLR